jgi:hypothetical protein
VAGPADPKLDALLREAAPDGVPPGFADAVLAAARARRRKRCCTRIVLAAAAAVLLLPLIRFALVERRPPTEGQQARRIVEEPAAQPHESEPEGGEAESFAIALPPAEGARQRVMMARLNGKILVVARPNDAMADELEELLRLPVTMAGSVSAGGQGPSMAIQFR